MSINTTYDGTANTLTPDKVGVPANTSQTILISPASGTTITGVTSTSSSGAPALTWSESSSNPGSYVSTSFTSAAAGQELEWDITVATGSGPQDPKFTVRSKGGGAGEEPQP